MINLQPWEIVLKVPDEEMEPENGVRGRHKQPLAKEGTIFKKRRLMFHMLECTGKMRVLASDSVIQSFLTLGKILSLH